MAQFDDPVAHDQPIDPAPQGRNPAEMLMQVEVPLCVSLGRTKMRMKDLLGLTHGSVVELDQNAGDEVEIRVNDYVIARGEVVAVDGNYGVRIVRMAADGNGRGTGPGPLALTES